MITASSNLGNLGNAIKGIAEAKVACAEAVKIIDRIPKIPLNVGKKLDDLKGNIQFNDVEFSYPSRENEVVLKKVSLTFESGKKTALVGPTGCGKSSIIKLIERYYNINTGEI